MSIKIKRWNESLLDTAEDFKVLQPIRINGASYSKGATVSLSGKQKRDLYLGKAVCYPDDFENVIAALESNDPVVIPMSNTADPAYVSGVELSGTKNGTNKVFTFPDGDMAVADSEEIHINSNTLLRGIGYTVTDTTVTLTAATEAPASDDYIWANYKKL